MKAIQIVSYATLALALVLTLFCAFNLFYPYRPIEIKSPAALEKHEFRHGDTIRVLLDVNKLEDKPCRVTRQFVDGIIYSLPIYKSNMPVGKYQVWDITTEIPNNLPAGEYYATVSLEYDYPPFRTVTYQFYTEKFQILP